MNDAPEGAVSPVSKRAHWEVVAEGWHFTREHYKTDPTKFVGDIPAPEYDAAMDALLLDILAVVMLHAKSDDTVEIEVFHDDDDPTACDDPHYAAHGCPGHIQNIHICDQCGVTFDALSGEAAWIEWPCTTAKRLGLADA